MRTITFYESGAIKIVTMSKLVSIYVISVMSLKCVR